MGEASSLLESSEDFDFQWIVYIMKIKARHLPDVLIYAFLFKKNQTTLH